MTAITRLMRADLRRSGTGLHAPRALGLDPYNLGGLLLPPTFRKRQPVSS
jgi:hypothetical protein